MKIIIHQSKYRNDSPIIEKVRIIDDFGEELILTQTTGMFDEPEIDLEMDEEFNIPIEYIEEKK